MRASFFVAFRVGPAIRDVAAGEAQQVLEEHGLNGEELALDREFAGLAQDAGRKDPAAFSVTPGGAPHR